MRLSRNLALVVEGDHDLRRLFRDALKFSGFEVYDASDGPVALSLMEQTPPDVVVLDIMLPTLDGYSVRDEIRAHAQTRDIPIVVVSGVDVDVARLNGARVLRKPIDPPELIAAVRASLAVAPGRRRGTGLND